MRKAITHSVDPEDLAARLAQVPSERGSPIRQMTPLASPEDGEFEVEVGPQECQARCYQALIEEGGRPLFDIELLPQISENVEEYGDLLRPWRLYPDSTHPTDWEVFHRQIYHWQEFRAAQLWHRGRTLGFPEFLEQQRRNDHMLGEPSKSMYGAEYEREQRGLWEREHGPSPPHECDTNGDTKAGILEYNNVLKMLLEHYGFVQPFQLCLEIEQQDQWTTFVEYLGFECHHLHLLIESTRRMQPQPAVERKESPKEEAVAPSAESTKSQHKRVYEVKGGATATDDEDETHGQTAKRQKQSETRAFQEQAYREQEIRQTNSALSRAARDREHKYQAAKARVAYHQCRFEWILSEISKIEVERKTTTSGSTGLAEMDERKTTSEASMDGPTDKEKMSSRKSSDSPTAQAEKLIVSEDESVSEDDAVPQDEATQDNVGVEDNEAVPEDNAGSENEVVLELQAKTSNKPSTENPGFVETKDVSRQFHEEDGNVENAAVSSPATGDSREIYNDGLKSLQPSVHGDVAVTASASTEVIETQRPKASSPSDA